MTRDLDGAPVALMSFTCPAMEATLSRIGTLYAIAYRLRDVPEANRAGSVPQTHLRIYPDMTQAHARLRLLMQERGDPASWNLVIYKETTEEERESVRRTVTPAALDRVRERDRAVVLAERPREEAGWTRIVYVDADADCRTAPVSAASDPLIEPDHQRIRGQVP
jgi:hypothetical protein